MTSASATAPVRRPVLRRVVLVLLGIVLLAAGGLAIAPAFVPTETVRARITEQIEQWLGRPVTFVGDPVISLYPRPTVTIEHVVISDALGDGVPLIAVERVVGTVALLPLIFGRVEISAFSLLRPEINLRVGTDGQSNWTVREGTIGARLAEAEDTDETGGGAPDVTLGRFLIEDGTITYRRADGPLSEITGVSLDISWPSTAGGMTASGRLTWRDEPVAITGYLGRPLDLIAGRSSSARFTVDATPASLSFDGTVSRSELDFVLGGMTSLTTPSLRRLLTWAGAQIPEEGATPGPATMEGDASWGWPLLMFSNGTISLDGTEAVGSFSVDFSNARPSIRGTIAASVVDLSPYAISLRTDVEADGTWVGAPIDLPALAVIDTDLRLSADEVRLGAARVTQVAASATVSGGGLLLSLEEATFYGGSVRATVSGFVGPDSLTLHAAASVSGMATLPALQAVAGVSGLAGTLTGTIDAGGSGATWSELAAALSGTVTATIVNGALRGIDLAGAAGVESPTVANLALGTGGTGFSRFEGDFHFAGGFLEADRFVAEGPGYVLAFSGHASLMRPGIEGRGVISFARSDETAILPFTLDGTWVMPVLADDPSPVPPESSPAASSPSIP
ncbi:MAG: AsmA family protein [Bauldia sp.]|nr:AsmA family protein [Bauldia sp.]